MSVSDKILDAIELLSKNSVQKAGYDKTIQAQILSCQDAAIGKYRCRYQDATIYAYSNNSNVIYAKGTYVYILVPSNDMSKEKTILGTTDKLGINYITQAVGDQAYHVIGKNCITDTKIFYLNTGNENYIYKIYDADATDNTETGNTNSTETDNVFNVNVESVEQYIKNASAIIVGGAIKTEIEKPKQNSGSYGIVFELEFKNQSEEENSNPIIRSYIIDEDNMTGNPYQMPQFTRQYQIFDIDSANFLRIKSISIFNKNFPGAKGTETGKLNSGDIAIKNLEFSFVERMTSEQLNGLSIDLITPQGTFFSKNEAINDTGYRDIIAQVKIKGRVVSDEQNVKFYWGKENLKVNTDSRQLYNKYLGRGWQCLNDYRRLSLNTDESFQTNTNETSQTDTDIIDWIPASNTYRLLKGNAVTEETKIKVAILYENSILSKEITIKNYGLSSDKDILSIQTDDGITQFYFDIGSPTLICKINGEDIGKEKEISRETLNNEENTDIKIRIEDGTIIEEVENTEEENNIITATKTTTVQRIKKIVYYYYWAYQSKDKVLTLFSENEGYQQIESIEDNKIIKVNIGSIYPRGTFKCSVFNQNQTVKETTVIYTYNDESGEEVKIENKGSEIEEQDSEKYLGTPSIVLYNSYTRPEEQEDEQKFSLIIQNGSAVFLYDEEGKAPTQPNSLLSFILYDKQGNQIDPEETIIRWSYPKKDTLLRHVMENNSNYSEVPESEDFYYYNSPTIIYGIEEVYDTTKLLNNQIKLAVTYNGTTVITQTNFMFVKQGESGTNGTEYVVRIVPNITEANESVNQTIISIKNEDNTFSYNLNYSIKHEDNIISKQFSTNEKVPFFKAILYRNGVQVINSTDQPLTYEWNVLQNIYDEKKEIKDNTSFTKVIGDENQPETEIGYFKFSGIKSTDDLSKPLANIIKCGITHQGKTYYGTIPVTLKWTAKNYDLFLKENTGFRYVIYSANGTLPQYDNTNPFTIQTKYNNTDVINAQYNFSGLGSYYGNYFDVEHERQEYGQIINNLLEPKNQTSESNYFNTRPKDTYDGFTVNTGIYCKVLDNNNITIGIINIPIHFMLNRFSMANINSWDGNSIKISDEEGYILSPQIGAGSKNSDNSFTGIIMGQVMAPEKDKQVGLFGYNEGVRTLFLNSENGEIIANKGNISDWILTNQNISAYEQYYQWNTAAQKFAYYKNRYEITRQGIKSIGTSVDNNIYITGQGKRNKRFIVNYSDGTESEDTTSNWSNLPPFPPAIYSGEHNTFNSVKEGFYLSSEGLSIGTGVNVLKNGTLVLGQDATLVKELNTDHDVPRCWIVGTDMTSTIAGASFKIITEPAGGDYGVTHLDGWATTSTAPHHAYIKYNYSSTGIKGTLPDNEKQGCVYLGTKGLVLGSTFKVDNSSGVVTIDKTVNNTGGNLNVAGNLDVKGKLTAGTFILPDSLSVSNLTVSTKLNVTGTFAPTSMTFERISSSPSGGQAVIPDKVEINGSGITFSGKDIYGNYGSVTINYSNLKDHNF